MLDICHTHNIYDFSLAFTDYDNGQGSIDDHDGYGGM